MELDQVRTAIVEAARRDPALADRLGANREDLDRCVDILAEVDVVVDAEELAALHRQELQDHPESNTFLCLFV